MPIRCKISTRAHWNPKASGRLKKAKLLKYETVNQGFSSENHFWIFFVECSLSSAYSLNPPWCTGFEWNSFSKNECVSAYLESFFLSSCCPIIFCCSKVYQFESDFRFLSISGREKEIIGSISKRHTTEPPKKYLTYPSQRKNTATGMLLLPKEKEKVMNISFWVKS